MHQQFPFVFSLITWFWGLVFLLMTALLLVDIGCLNNFHSQTQGTIARAGGLTPHAQKMISQNNYHNLFKVTTLKYDKSDRIVQGDKTGPKVGYGDTVNYVIWPKIPFYYNQVINVPVKCHIMSDARQDDNS